MNIDFSKIFYGNHKIRGPIVDGIFYPDDDLLLQNRIKELLDKSDIKPGNSFGIITPHAALPFSGLLAASSFQSAAARDVDKVVIIAPVHRDSADYLFLTESAYFSIPTGNVKVDLETVDKLLAFDPLFKKNDMPHLEEHCIEIQLPFIEYLFPEASIIPVLVGNSTVKLTNTLVNGIKTVFAEDYSKTLFVVSANITNYIPKDEAREYTEFILKLIESGNIENLFSEIEKNKIKSRGLGCIAALLSLAGNNSEIDILGRKDSSKSQKKNEKVVCYASISVNIKT